jgi:hypothetical protein
MKNNIKNNMLSLKALQAELEQIKSAQAQQVHNNHPHTDVAGHDIKGSYINRIYMKSSMFTLWLITGILSYAHKIPYIGHIIAVLSLWYGKTTWWRILAYVRKIFITVNAIIGVFVVFNSVGFSTDNILAGVSALGHQYYEILISFTKRLFNWFVELFDHKIVPNVPNNPPKSWPKLPDSWTSIPKVDKNEDTFESLRSIYTKDININVTTSTPWYKDLSTWLWVGGSVIGIGLLYVGYKFCTDPLFIDNLFGSTDIKGKGKAPSIEPDGSGIPLEKISSGSDTTNSIVALTTYIRQKLNPFNYFTSASETQKAFREFMDKQFKLETADRRYYPFTEVNPYASYSDRLKRAIFGESLAESNYRLKLQETAYDIYNKIKVKGGNTPIPSNLGLSTPIPSVSSFLDVVQTNNVENLFKSLPGTPKVYIYNSNLPPVIINEASEISDWNTHVRDSIEDMTSRMDEYFTQKAIDKNLSIPTSSKVTIDDLPLENPFTE